jgi:hypothetical protein
MPSTVTITIEDHHQYTNAKVEMTYRYIKARPDRAKVGELAEGVWDRVYNPSKITPARGVET